MTARPKRRWKFSLSRGVALGVPAVIGAVVVWPSDLSWGLLVFAYAVQWNFEFDAGEAK